MADETKGFQLYPRIESLSDMIFGLALSVGALTLMSQQVTTMPQLIGYILHYAFSFIILVGVWRAYTISTAALTFETSPLFKANILLLFFVTIEPFLYNMLYMNNISGMSESISILYALNLAGMFLILAFFSHMIYQKKDMVNGTDSGRFRVRRNGLLISAAIVLVSCLPIFWSTEIPLSILGLSPDSSIPLRFILWIISPLMINLYTEVDGRYHKEQRQNNNAD
jgi:uncharacterized membrane protein